MRYKAMTKIFLSFLFILILSVTVTASVADDGMTYTHPAVDARGSYTQGGSGSWDTVTNPTIKTLSLDTHEFNIPLIRELTGDTVPEIIIQNNDTLSIYTIDDNENIILLDSEDIGSPKHTTLTHNIYATPGAVRRNATHTSIITLNGTHVLHYTFNTTNLALTDSKEIVQVQAPSDMYPRIICTEQLWSDNDHKCVWKHTNRTAGVAYLHYSFYDVNQSRYNISSSIRTLNGVQDTWHTTPKVIDADASGNIELYGLHASTALTPPDLYIDKCEIGTVGITCTQVHMENMPAGTDHTDYTDILINNLDGTLTNGYEISFGWSDNTNWYVKSLNPSGTVLESQYFGLITNDIEGDYALENLIDHPDCGIGQSDAALVVHDDSDEETFIGCVSLYAGVQTNIIEVTDGSEFVSKDMGVAARMTGDTTYDILYSNVILDLSEEEIIQNFTGADHALPVDLARIGYLDLILLNGTQLWYYDDGLVNSNVVIDSFAWSSGNPVCNNTLVRFDVGITDETDDYSSCSIRVIRVSDNSYIYNSSNQSGYPPTVFQYTYNFDELDSFYVDVTCQDQYHTDTVTYRYNLWTGLPPNCFGYNQGGDSDDADTQADDAADEDAEDNISEAFSDVGIVGPKMKALFWLLVMLGVTFLTFTAVRGAGVGFGIPLAAVNILMLVLGWILGMIGSVILVIVGLFTALVIVLALFGRSNSAMGG